MAREGRFSCTIAGRFSWGVTYLVEVKSTVRDQVALTPLQARTAGTRPERFVLCVVQLAAIPAESATESELVELATAHARFVPDLGPDAAHTVGHVQAAAGGTVGLKNEQELRYVVKQHRWSGGLSLIDWVRLVCMDAAVVAIPTVPGFPFPLTDTPTHAADGEPLPPEAT